MRLGFIGYVLHPAGSNTAIITNWLQALTSQAHLYWDQYEGDHKLRCGADEFWRRDRLLALLEDAVDPVGLCKHGWVRNAHAQPQQQPAESTHHRPRLSDHQEGDEVDEEDSRQEHVAELTARGPHDGGVVEADEGDDDGQGGQDAKNG